METPLPYEPPVVSAELTKSPAREWWRAHVVAIVFFVPFSLMLVLHRFLGLSDALMAAPAPGQPDSFLYNIMMVGAFYFGVAGYIFHVLALSRKEPRWVFVKLALLVVIWAMLISAMP